MKEIIKKPISSFLGIIILLILVIFVGLYITFLSKSLSFYFSPSFFVVSSPFTPSNVSELSAISEFKEMKKFSSAEDFQSYLKKSEIKNFSFFGFLVKGPLLAPTPLLTEEKITPERISETNVQIKGIDEPDIVKTDGQRIYFSPQETYYRTITLKEKLMPPQINLETKIIKAFPPSDLNLETKIDQKGDLLLTKNILVIFSDSKIYGYDVSNPKSPEKKWEIKLDEKNQILSARLFKDKIYLVVQTQIISSLPCPIKPLVSNGVPLEIKCLDIYYPNTVSPVDVTFTAMVVDPLSGEIEKNISFVGSSNDSILYMSENNLYLTYTYYGDFITFYYRFFKEKAQDLVPVWFIKKLEKLVNYEISQTAKLTELQVIFNQYKNSLNDDERLKIENEIQNRITDYFKENKRELEKTGIVKIELENFVISNVGNVYGRPLNQFSLDEYKDHLRIATTVGEVWRFGMPLGFFNLQQETANDVYVLDKNLNLVGSLYDLGLTEKIYSVRFLEDKGYLVTFRQTDPFYVLDLSDPTNPVLKGELKIPGYSSYLHPITKDKILGIGKEDFKVKISLFDVEKPERPKELAKYNLDEYWSDILNTHHAFLLDNKHQIFFLPASKGGYIFSYQNDKLELKKIVSGTSARRAIYLDDYLYIIGDDKITVLNETNWEKIKELEI